MLERNQGFTDPERQRQHEKALSRSQANPCAPVQTVAGAASAAATPEVPPLTNAELVQLQVRVIALENIVIALLAQAPERQLELAREMAAYIAPRPGFTPHHLTVEGAAQMISLVERAGHFRTEPAS